MAKRKMNIRHQIMGALSWIDPLYMVASQLKIFTPLGTATKKVRNENTTRAVSAMPEVKRWWAQTSDPMPAMAMEE